MAGMMVENGRGKEPFGVMGGADQAVGNAHVISNMLDYGMDVQQALDSPRAFPGAEALDLEPGLFSEAVSYTHSRAHQPG